MISLSCSPAAPLAEACRGCLFARMRIRIAEDVPRESGSDSPESRAAAAGSGAGVRQHRTPGLETPGSTHAMRQSGHRAVEEPLEVRSLARVARLADRR